MNGVGFICGALVCDWSEVEQVDWLILGCIRLTSGIRISGVMIYTVCLAF